MIHRNIGITTLDQASGPSRLVSCLQQRPVPVASEKGAKKPQSRQIWDNLT